MFKKCPRCQITKTEKDFWKSSRNNDGYQVYCIDCQKEKDKKQRERRRLLGPVISRDSKICNRCQTMKPISQFGIRRDSADGRMSYCKPCWVTYVKLAQIKAKNRL